MSMRSKALAFLLCNLFPIFSASADSDPLSPLYSNSLNANEDVNKDAGLTPESFVFWPNGTVPFYINSSHFDHEQRVQIMTALSNFAFKTCLKFQPVMTAPEPYHHVLVLRNPEGVKQCNFVEDGHDRFQPHYVTLGYRCLQSPNIDMMIMKALGFPFEHNRLIRDLYIDVQRENVEPGHGDLYTKDMKLPQELRSLPYDVNSVTHFGEREFSKNGHRTIIIKNPNTKQKRHSLTNLDLRRIEIVYGPECLKRDRLAKLKECMKYPDVPSYPGARLKRAAETSPPPLPVKSLRVNPDITPPPSAVPAPSPAATGELPEALAGKLKTLGIEEQVQEIVDKVHVLSSKALTDARKNYCNKTESVKATANKSVNLIEVLELVASYAESMVNHAVQNLTMFCEAADPVAFYQRGAWCQFNNPRCVQTYFKSTHLWHRDSTQYRPSHYMSTKDWSWRPVHWNLRAQNDNETDNQTDTTPSVSLTVATAKARRKREATDVNDGVVTPRYRVQHAYTPTSNKVKFTGEPKEMYKPRQDSDDDDWQEARVTALHFEKDEESKGDDSEESKVREATKKHSKKAKRRPHKVIEYAPASTENEDTPAAKRETKNAVHVTQADKTQLRGEDAKYVNVLKSKKKVNRDNNMEKKKVYLPKTVNLSKQNEEFYDMRRWRDGVVRYIIADVGGSYDLADMRQRLDEVNQILKRKTCVRIQEITEQEAPKYEDYLVIDTSPDYVTGKVGGRQIFGAIELFAGGQHRQHAAMMVMAMLGFYFEVSRHDRDKHIVVHPRNIRPDKLHHFEMLRSDATLAVPYDYASATQPAWQFWRKFGKTGIATVATFKEMDPDGKTMKMLGQHPELLSEIDLVKINSVYGTKCLGGKGPKGTTKKDKSQTYIQ